jgi:benzoate/toluate 1,2-dioxygenase alpha subunit
MSQYIDDDRQMPRFRVNRNVMTDPEVFAQEQEKIFNTTWLYLGHESELKKPNDFKTRTVGGRPLIFAKDKKGAVRVWINSCPHRGAMICREDGGNARFMTCAYHGWSFSTSGDLVSMPGDQAYGPEFERPGLAAPAQIDSYRGFVFVTFNAEAPDLLTHLAGAAEYLDLVSDMSESGMEVLEGTHHYSARANWKLLVENSYDGYHAMSTHQRYFEMIVAARGPIDAGKSLKNSRSVNLGNGHAVTVGGPGSGDIFGRELSEEARAEKEARYERLRAKHGEGWVKRMDGIRNMVIFPNLVIIDLVMGVVIRKIDPVSPDYMEVTAWELAPPEEGPELKRQRLDNFLTFWGPGGLASPDDVEMLESAQKAFASVKELEWSDISRGMHADVPVQSDEYQMRTFWRQWNEIITGEVLPPEDYDDMPDYWTSPRLELEANSTVAAS